MIRGEPAGRGGCSPNCYQGRGPIIFNLSARIYYYTHIYIPLYIYIIIKRPRMLSKFTLDLHQSYIPCDYPSVSIKHLCPAGTIRKCNAGSMSLSDMPSTVETLALGKALKNRVVMRRSSILAKCLPRHAIIYVSFKSPHIYTATWITEFTQKGRVMIVWGMGPEKKKKEGETSKRGVMTYSSRHLQKASYYLS